jgi:hypothetical protein
MWKNFSIMSLFEIVKQYKHGAETITAWLGSGGQTVTQRHAQQRADVCLKCPMNVSSFLPTKAIAIAVKNQLEIKSKLQLRVIGEKSLQTCRGCGCILRLKIWIPLENLGIKDGELDNFVPECWMRKESEKNELPDKTQPESQR